MTEHSHKNLAEALAAFQGEAPLLYKGKEVKGSFTYKYVDLAHVVEAIKPLMVKHGLSWSAFPCHSPDGKPALRYKLNHVSGDCESEVMPLMLAKADAQALGSAITYARRYALCAVLNIVADADDDGAAAKAAAKAPPQKAPPRATPTSPELVGAAEIKALQAAAHGLKAAQVKQAMASCNVTPPDPFVPASCFLRVPRDKAAVLVEALSSADVPWAGELPNPDPVAPEVS